MAENNPPPAHSAQPDPLDHDGFVKSMVQNTQKAATLFKKGLSQPLAKAVDWNTLVLSKDSAVDDELSASYADMMFTVQLAGDYPIRLALLFEHKSAKPPTDEELYNQLLRYKANGYALQRKQLAQQKRKRKQKGLPKLPHQRLTPIIPVVFYHGQEGWQPRPLEDLFFAPGVPNAVRALIRPYLDSFTLEFFSLQAHTSQTIRQHYAEDPELATELLLLKHIWEDWTGEFVALVQKVFEPAAELDDYHFQLLLKRGLVYLGWKATGRKQEIITAIQTLFVDKTEATMNVLEEIKAEGIAEGEQQGIKIGEQRGKQQGEQLILSIARQLRDGNSPVQTAELLNIPLAKVLEVKQSFGL